MKIKIHTFNLGHQVARFELQYTGLRFALPTPLFKRFCCERRTGTTPSPARRCIGDHCSNVG